MATSVSGAANVSSTGNKTLSLTGKDTAGNETTISCPYVVVTAKAAKKVPLGYQMNLFSHPTAFAANTAFNIRHGWLLNPTATDVGKFSFTLQVDGSYRTKNFVSIAPVDGNEFRAWVFNFPTGMTGTHTFIGHLRGPCYAGPGPCGSNPQQASGHSGSHRDRHLLLGSRATQPARVYWLLVPRRNEQPNVCVSQVAFHRERRRLGQRAVA